MAKVLETLIAKGRRVKRPKDQREVAFGLADLSTHGELHLKIVQKGGVSALVKLLEGSEDLEAQRFAAVALGNICSTPTTRLPVAEEGVIR